jgi:hypothetical protein
MGHALMPKACVAAACSRSSGKKSMLTRNAIPQILLNNPELLSSELNTAAPHKTFHHVIDIYLKDSNAFMNTYFARYFEWQGVCRALVPRVHSQQSAGFRRHVRHETCAPGIRQETFPFQRVDCYLNTLQVRQCSAIWCSASVSTNARFRWDTSRSSSRNRQADPSLPGRHHRAGQGI